MKTILSFFILFNVLLCAKSDLDYKPDTLISLLTIALQNQDQILLERELIPSQNEYIDIIKNGRKINNKETEYYSQRYIRNKQSLLQSWNSVIQYLENNKIDFSNAELLYYGIRQHRKVASFSPVFRINKQDYRLRLSECLLIHGKWKVSGPVTIDKVKRPKPIFTKAKSTWGDQLNPTLSIPSNGFKIFYFDIKSKKLLETSYSDSLHVDMSNDRNFIQRHKIDEKNFAAYLVGNIKFEKEEKKNVAIRHTHWSKVRVIIDGNVICKDQCSRDIEYTFKPGEHKIEVEYMSNLNPINWASVTVKLVDKQEQLTKKEAQRALIKFMTPQTKLWYVSVYQAKDGNQPVQLNLKNSKDPIVLFISSYKAMDLLIKNIDNAKLKSIVFSGDDATTINFEGKNRIPIIRLVNYESHRLLFGNTILPKCIEGPVFHCDGGIEPVLDQIETFAASHMLNGLTLNYDTNVISVPKHFLSEKDHIDIRQKTAEIYEQQKQLLAPKQYSKLFNLTDKKVPISKKMFKVTYYDRKRNQMVLSKLVNNIALRAGLEIEGIKSENLLAKWEGVVTMTKSEEKLFEISNGWSEVKILVDGKTIYDQTEKPGNRLKTVKHYFSPGEHHVEVRFVNGWHTADLYVNLKTPFNPYNLDEASKILEPLLSDTTSIFYTGIGGSDNENVQTMISFKKSTNPIILFMRIKKPTNVKIDNRLTKDLKAVVYYAEQSSSIELLGTNDVPIIPLSKPIHYVEGLPTCEYSRRFESEYCRNVFSITHLNDQMKEIIGKRIDGFGSQEVVSHMRMPAIIMNEKQYRRIAEIQKKEKKLAQARKEKSAKEIDKIKRGRFETTFEK